MSKEDIWKEILEIAELERIENTKQDGEMTISEFCKKTGMKRSIAIKFLESKVEKGELIIRVLPISGGTRVYKPVT